jgi:hypothetical protein
MRRYVRCEVGDYRKKQVLTPCSAEHAVATSDRFEKELKMH